MTTSKLKRICKLEKTATNFEYYKKQQYFCVNLSPKSRAKRLSNIHPKKINDIKDFAKLSEQDF